MVELAVLASVLSLAAPEGGEIVVLEGVAPYSVKEPCFEGVRVLLAYRGEVYSPAYIQGISGAAFRIAGPCPCAPTCSLAMWTADLLRLLGHEVESVSLAAEESAPVAGVEEMIARVKDEIRSGRPVLVWHAFTNAEWDVVCGFDESAGEFLGRGSYGSCEGYARADASRAASAVEICPAYGALVVGERTGAFDAREAELGALEEAVRHGRTPRDEDLERSPTDDAPWRFREGEGVYVAWARSFQADPDKVPDAGDRYPLSVYASTHAAAGGFLREIAPSYPEARDQLERAAEWFEADAALLRECYESLCGRWEDWQAPDRQRAARFVALMTRAHFAYTRGISEVAMALGAIAPERLARARAHAPAQDH